MLSKIVRKKESIAMMSTTLTAYLRPVVVATTQESVSTAARRLRDKHVGCVVVTRDGHPIGIVTDRDLAVRVVAEARDPKHTSIGEIVTFDPVTLRDDETIDSAVLRMKESGVRRLPIVDAGGHVVGIVTADDLLIQLGRQLAAVADAVDNAADASESR